MPYAGHQMMARDVAREARKYWQNYELTKAVATFLGESHLFLDAWHDNLDSNGNVTSRDSGIIQNNVAANTPGTEDPDPGDDAKYRTPSLDPAVYTPIFETSIARAWELYNQPWQRNGKSDIRRWQPWYACSDGWATFPFAWVYHHDLTQDPPTCPGPWVKTGRYIHQAIAGQMNNLVVNEKIWTPDKALTYAQKYAAHFNITDGSEPYLTQDKLGNTIVSWHYPPMPSTPPADGCGPYPQPNDGS